MTPNDSDGLRWPSAATSQLVTRALDHQVPGFLIVTILSAVVTGSESVARDSDARFKLGLRCEQASSWGVLYTASSRGEQASSRGEQASNWGERVAHIRLEKLVPGHAMAATMASTSSPQAVRVQATGF